MERELFGGGMECHKIAYVDFLTQLCMCVLGGLFCFVFTLCVSDIADVLQLNMLVCEAASLWVICSGGDDDVYY